MLARIRWRRWAPWAVALVAAIVALLAIEALRGIAGDLSAAELGGAISRIPRWRLGVAIGLVAASYGALSCYDGLALRLLGRRLPFRLTAYAGFTSFAISNNLGLALVTGGSARFTIYDRAGLTKIDIARLIAICSANFWSALLTLTGAVLVLAGRPLPFAPGISSRLIGVALFALVALGWALFLGAGRWRSRLLGGASLDWRALALLQVAGFADIICAASVLFVLLGVPAAEWPQLAVAYAVALVAGVVSHVPAGLGVFDAAFLSLAPVGAGVGVAAVLLYRLVYYVLPLGIALALQAGRLGRRFMAPARKHASTFIRLHQSVTPTAAALLVTGAGALLLFSVATPAEPGRLRFVKEVLPLPLIDASHFLASLAATALLLLAPALNARLRSALILTTALLVGGALLCLAKGIDYEEALALLLVAALLQSSSSSFHRTTGIGSAPIGALSWSIILAVLGAAIIAMLLSHNHPLFAENWWTIELRHEAPRSVRSLLAAALLLSFVGFRQLISATGSSRAEPLPPSDVLERSLAACERSDAFLALTGDKQFLVSDEGDAFLMYRARHRTWVVMGDPVGAHARWGELAWRLREAADREAGLVCFYEVSERMLPVLVDLGLATMKYGEEALLDLASDYALPKGIRATLRRLERLGLEFEIIPSAVVPDWIPVLREVSNEWLRDKPGDEKCFSLGGFDPDYLARFDCAVVRQEGRILAFANIWALPNMRECSIDLMRRRHDAPNGTMEFLIGHCILHAASAGFHRFTLGMAPLAGLASRPLAPRWARFGSTIYHRGNRLYSFKGLRAFKEKFHPRWESRYVATFHGLRGWRALLDAARLIG